jgi:hypothetical protein
VGLWNILLGLIFSSWVFPMARAEKQFYLLNTFCSIPINVAGEELQWLGCILKNLDDPYEGFLSRPAEHLLSESDYYNVPFSDTDALIKRTKSTTLKGTLLNWLGNKHERKGETTGSFAGKKVDLYRLQNDEDLFQGMLKADGYRVRLDPWLSRTGVPPYLVVGFLVAGACKDDSKDAGKDGADKDAVVLDNQHKISSTDGVTVDVPASAITVPTTGIPVPGNVGGGIEILYTEEVKIKASPQGRSIFALQCRAIRRELFSSTRPKLKKGPQGDKAFGGAKEPLESQEIDEQIVLGLSPVSELLAELGADVSTEEFDEYELVFNEDDIED